MVKMKSMLPTLPLMAVIVTSIIAIVLLTFGQISENFAIVILLTLLSAYILDEVIENVVYKEKFNDVMKKIEKNTHLTDSIHKEVYRQKAPCELVDPCKKSIWIFEDDMHWYNAPLVLAEDEIFNTIKDAYSRDDFTKASYLFYRGKEEDDIADFEKRMKRFRKIMERLVQDNDAVARKITARVVDDEPPGFSFFLGKKGASDECIVYVMEKPFVMESKKGGQPGFVFILQERELVRRLHTIFNNEWAKGEELAAAG